MNPLEGNHNRIIKIMYSNENIEKYTQKEYNQEKKKFYPHPFP